LLLLAEAVVEQSQLASIFSLKVSPSSSSLIMGRLIRFIHSLGLLVHVPPPAVDNSKKACVEDLKNMFRKKRSAGHTYMALKVQCNKIRQIKYFVKK